MKSPSKAALLPHCSRVAILLGVSFAASLNGAAVAQDAAKESPAPAPPRFILWTDTSVTLLPYGWGFEVNPSEQSTFTFEHAHASAIGDFFMFVDATRFHDRVSGADKRTWYGEIGPRLSLGKTLKKDLSFALYRHSLFEFKDVLIAAQYERGENADVAEAALIGVGFDLDIRESGLLGPLGQFKYIQLNLYGRAELTEGAADGISDMQVTMAAAKAFDIGSAKFLVDGYFDWVLGLGSEGWNFHLNPQIKLDIGNFRGSPDKFFAGVELDFWWNKYQIPDSPAFDTDQAAASLMFKYHF